MRQLSPVILLCLAACSGDKADAPAAKPKAPSASPKPAETPLPQLEGFPLRNLPPSARRPFAEIAQEELCGCNNPRTLAFCLSKKEPCGQALVLANMLKSLLESGLSRAQAQLVFSRLITDGMCTDPVEGIDASAFPTKTNVAPGQPAIEVVEFADFMCGHCAAAAPQFSPVVASGLPVRMRFVPIQVGGHETSKTAAIAALAAWRQGPEKFWPFHDKLFAHQLELSEAKITALAKEAGLDLARLTSDRKNPQIEAIYKSGKQLSVKAGLKGTPYVLINGRPLNNTVTAADLASRIQLELLRGRKECEE